MTESKAAPTTALFDVSITSGKALVRREFVFSGAKISFDIEVPVKNEQGSMTLADLHQESVRTAISLLQGLVPPKK